eukprot:TRINITY_DN43395_c0_g1_i1.p1 TRINITY_DN43395_c0_g1~~TRINITY_DN43395_c0_g1_i1.p1  ORF type:complete len:420 (-),score=63.94 TRINITY_DN43395_c0_g1_i1:319-1470(-)
MAIWSNRCREIGEFLTSVGEPQWRYRQVIHGVYKAHARKWHHIEGLPSGLQWRLKDRFGRFVLSYRPGDESEGDYAQKVLLKARRDEARVEAVSLQFRTHRSLCISSQVGCAFKCGFCATGRVGLKRQLDADEISDQVLYFLQQGQKVDGVSLMGMGEPLANPKVFDALRILTSQDLFGFSARRMNVSTVGVIPGILKLTEEMPQVNVAFSLHSPFTEERNKLVPLNRMYPFGQVFDVLDRRIRKTGRRVWICYLVLQGQNDTQDHAKALVQLLKDRPSETRYLYHVNLLPYNVGRSVPEQFQRADVGGVEVFQKILQENNVSCSYRNSFGSSIDAACGQLFAGYEDTQKSVPGRVRPASETRTTHEESQHTPAADPTPTVDA